jgi:hypothetical protein
MKTTRHALLRGWPLLVALMAFGATAASTDVRVWGNFGRLMHTGGASAQVVLVDVVTGTASAAHCARHALGHAERRRFTAARTDGVLLGLYSASALEGVVSHPGERFHVHFATSDDARPGHVDACAVAAGAVLLLPVPQ